VSPVALLIFYVLLALGVSFLCSVLEAVLLSITPSYIATLEGSGNPAGAKLRGFKDDIDRPLAAILSLNTVAHTVGASGAGAKALEVFGDAYVAAASAVLTLLILIFSEIIPKTLGARYWKVLAPYAARVLKWLIYVTLPLVWLSQGITRLMGGSPHGEPAISREEFEILADIGSKDGILDEEESRILANLFRLNALRARDVMTPRTVILAFDEDMTVAEAMDDEQTMRFSRIPIYNKNVDGITGYVLKQEILLSSARDMHDKRLDDLRRDLLIIPVHTKLHRALDMMLERQEHIALLIDEYGGTVGILTMEDLVETLLGLEIVDELDATVDMQGLARKEWEKRAARLGLTGKE
jgi:CBS domain containing-hemolysin-like protein